MIRTSLTALLLFAAIFVQPVSADEDAIMNRYIDLAKTDVLNYRLMARITADFTMYASKPLAPEEQAFLREQSKPAVVRPHLIENMKRRKVKTEDLEYEIQMLESDIGAVYMGIVETCKCFSIELMPEGIQAAGIAKTMYENGEIPEEQYTRLSEFLLSKQHTRFYFDHRSSILGSGSKRRKTIKKGLKKIRKSLKGK